MEVIQDKLVDYIDDILLADGKLQAVAANTLAKIDNTDLRLWCHKHAIYGLPSLELLEIIRPHLVEGKSIEVGGGCGVFGRLLGIPSTDSCIQSNDAMRAYYRALGQPPVTYGDNIINLEASEAIAHFKPEVVFGSWVTQYVSPLEVGLPPGGGSVYGLRETEFINNIHKYIIYGNEAVHGLKALFNLPGVKVERIKSEHFFSRAQNPNLNCLYIITNVNYHEKPD